MQDVIEYTDQENQVRGWLAYDGRSRPLAAGGCRVQPGLDAAQLSTLASRMSMKQRVLGLNVDGAKCGIDLDPRSPHKDAALAGFFGFLRDELSTRYSMGPDMGTEWQELQRHADRIGLPSIKYAIRTAQRLSDDEFAARMATLEQQVGVLTLGQRRAGHALGHAAVAAARAAGATGQITVALQGFGNLGRPAAYSLLEEGARIVAIGDEHGCVVNMFGIDLLDAMSSPPRTPVPKLPIAGVRCGREAVLETPVDVLVLAAGADAVDDEHTQDPHFLSVAVGANCGLGERAEVELYTERVFVVPDFIGGIGGSASMEALFGPAQAPTATQVLDNLARMMWELVDDIADRSRRSGVTPRQAALRLADGNETDPTAPPYGSCRYLTTYSA